MIIIDDDDDDEDECHVMCHQKA